MKRPPVRTMRWAPNDDRESLLTREWLVGNGRAGYASGSIAGVPTRRFHGLLVASLPAPIGRAMMLNHLFEWIRLPDGSSVSLGGYERHDGLLEVGAAPVLREFGLEAGLPVWRFEIGSFVVEKRLFLVYLQNTVQVTYRILGGDGVLRVKLRPSVSFRPHEGDVHGPKVDAYALLARHGKYEIEGPSGYPPLRMRVIGDRHAFTIDDHEVHGI